MSQSVVVEADKLTVRYRGRWAPRELFRRTPAPVITAVEDVSLGIAAGQIVALVGESGSGKSTTGQAMLGLIDRRRAEIAGSVTFEGTSLFTERPDDIRPLRRWMQPIYQDPCEALDPRQRVRQILQEPLRIHRATSSEENVELTISSALERVGLTPNEFLDRYPHQLSGGERQRVVIASALVLRPRFVVADEPVSMLDMSVRTGVLSLLREMRGAGLALLMITHDLSTAAHHADFVAVMRYGRIVELGPARRIIEDPQDVYTRALIAAVPSIRRPTPVRSPKLSLTTPLKGGQ